MCPLHDLYNPANLPQGSLQFEICVHTCPQAQPVQGRDTGIFIWLAVTVGGGPDRVPQPPQFSRQIEHGCG